MEKAFENFERIICKTRIALMTVNLAKNDFCKATVNYLGHNIGQGKVKPLDSKVQAILDFPNPTNK